MCPIAVLIWLMIIPMMMKVDFGAIHDVGQKPRGLAGHAVRELAGEAVLDGLDRLAVLPLHFFARGSIRRKRTSTSPAASFSLQRRVRQWCSFGAT